MKKKLFAAVALCIAALLGISGFTGCANNPSEVGNWKLSYFGDGESNYLEFRDRQAGKRRREPSYRRRTGRENDLFHSRITMQ